MHKTDADYVADFKLPGGRINDSVQHAAVVRYIQSLEAKILQLVLEKPNQFVLKPPMTNVEAQAAALHPNSNLGGGSGQPCEFTGRYGPDCGPGVAGCSDCEAGRCTMDCGGRAPAEYLKPQTKIND